MLPAYLTMVGADEMADALFYVALGWVAARVGSPAEAAAILAAGTIPRISVLLLGGVIGDRLGVARVAIWTLIARLALMLTFAVTFYVGSPGVVVLALLAAGVGLADALHMPAMRGVAGLIAAKGEQMHVQSALSAVSNGAAVVGTAIGGILLGWVPGLVGSVAGALLIVAAVCLIALRRRAKHQLATGSPAGATTSSMWSMLREGVATLLRDPVSRLALLLFALANFASTSPIFLGIPLKATENNWSPIVYGLACLGFSIGYMVGGTVSARLEPPDSGVALPRAVGLMAPGVVALVILAFTTSPWVVGVTCFVFSLFFAPAVSLLRGVLQERTSPNAMGRVNSVVQFSIYSLIPVGHILFGALASVSLLFAGLVMAAILGAIVVFVGALARSTASAAAAPSSK